MLKNLMNSDNEPELVDLGLPSGNLWMKCNLRAKSETDFGRYYQWGSLVGYQGKEAKKHSYWDTSPFNNGKDEFNEEYFLKNRYKWIYKDGLLKPEYDIVTQTYGENYRTPNKEDFQELLDNTIPTFIENYKDSEINGKLFESMVNENTLFIPFSGGVWDGSLYNVGSYCYLWSGRLYSSDPNCAYYLYCNSDNAGLGYYGGCYYGFALRGIKVRDE